MIRLFLQQRLALLFLSPPFFSVVVVMSHRMVHISGQTHRRRKTRHTSHHHNKTRTNTMTSSFVWGWWCLSLQVLCSPCASFVPLSQSFIRQKSAGYRPLWATIEETPATTSSRTSSEQDGSSVMDAGFTNITLVVPQHYFGEADMDDNEDSLQYPSPLHNIHVETIMSEKEAAKALGLAREYAHQTGRWNQPDTERHSTYATCDFAVEDCESLGSYLEDIGFHERVWNRLEKLYGVEQEDMTYMDFFCANYQAKEGESSDNAAPNVMDRLEPHRDGSVLSFTVTLTPPQEYEGGGTFFDALDDGSHGGIGVVRAPRAGDAVLHSGKLLHGGHVVTKGQRTVLVGFVDVADWCVREGVLQEACRDLGRMDVAKYHYQRQQSRSADSQESPNLKWLPKRGSCLRPKRIPAMHSINVRADPSFQRLTRLETEDVLLRSLLLPEKKDSPELFFREQGIQEFGRDLFDGDITVL